MAKKVKSVSLDNRSVDIEDEYALDFWTRELSVTRGKLKAAVQSVGTAVAHFRRELKK